MSPENEVLPSFLEAGLDFGGPNFWRKNSYFPSRAGPPFSRLPLLVGGSGRESLPGPLYRRPPSHIGCRFRTRGDRVPNRLPISEARLCGILCGMFFIPYGMFLGKRLFSALVENRTRKKYSISTLGGAAGPLSSRGVGMKPQPGPAGEDRKSVV